MLSIVDIKKELGTNIYIYPIHSDSIKPNSIDLHVSKFGWSVKTKAALKRNVNHIIIPANDTALLYTEESVFVSDKIGGSFHSKVTLVSLGLGHISTTLDATYVGNLLIAMHNHSNHDISLKIGQELISLHLFYLNTPSYTEQTNDPGHPRMLNGFEKQSVDEYISWRDENQWNTDQRLLYTKMLSSTGFKQCKSEYVDELKKFSKHKIWHMAKNRIFWITLLALVAFILAIPAYFIDFGDSSHFLAKLCETFIYPVFAGFLIAKLIS